MSDFDGSIPPREALKKFPEPRPALAAWIAQQIDVDGVPADSVANELDAVAVEGGEAPVTEGLRGWASELRQGGRPDRDYLGGN